MSPIGMQGTPRLSAVILTLNDAGHVVPCLESLQAWVDEIVVLDSGSSDDTIELCRHYTDHILKTDGSGEGLQRQRSLDAASGKWILCIDADERVSPELRDEIEAIIRAPAGQIPCTGYSIPREPPVSCGPSTHGGFGDLKIRLFRRDAGRFDLEVPVDPQPVLEPRRLGKLNGRLIHDRFG